MKYELILIEKGDISVQINIQYQVERKRSYHMFYLTFTERQLQITYNKNLNKTLHISYDTCAIVHPSLSLSQSESSAKIYHTHMFTFYTLLGIQILNQQPFLVVAKEVHDSLVSIGPSQIYQIKRVQWIPIAPFAQADQLLLENTQQITEMQKLFDEGYHYFSDSYNLASPYEVNKLRECSLFEKEYYEQFIWNLNLIRMDSDKQHIISSVSLKDQKINYESDVMLLSKWCSIVIEGYLETFICNMPQNLKIRYYLITRRSTRKAGTRFYARGIDDDGFVANYAETEQIIFLRDLVLLHLQIRGSVPVFFEQLGINGIVSELNIERTQTFTKKAFLSHFNQITNIYQRVLCINLLSQKKQQESTLTQFYQQMIDHNSQQLQAVRYQFFDFHVECKDDKFQKTQLLIQKINEIIVTFNLTCYDIAHNQFLRRQSGVIRTNCLDCLDRTNYVQSRIALTVIQNAIKGLVSPHSRQIIEQFELFKNQSTAKGSDMQEEQAEKEQNNNDKSKSEDMRLQYPILNLFNSLWAQNGDSISLHYTGIGSTHSDITKTGKRTFFGGINHKMKSLMRFYTQFTDYKKHLAINRFVGSNRGTDNSAGTDHKLLPKEHSHPTPSSYNHHPTSNIHSIYNNPTEFHQVLIFSLSLHQEAHINTVDLLVKMQNQIKRCNPSIIVLYLFHDKQQNMSWFQKMKNKLVSNEDTKALYLKKSISEIQKQLLSMKYMLIGRMETGTSSFSVYCKDLLIGEITHIKKQNLSTELNLNEEVLVIKFNFYYSSLIFTGINCNNFNHFNSILDQIHQKAFQIAHLGKNVSSSMLDHHYRTIIGNIGSHIELDQEIQKKCKLRMSQLLQQGKMGELSKLIHYVLDHDQFSNYSTANIKQISNRQQGSKLMKYYSEGPVEFIPEQNRIIFWNKQSLIIKVLSYKQEGLTPHQELLTGLLSYQIKKVPN